MRPFRVLVVYKKSQLELLRRRKVRPRGPNLARLRHSDRENRRTLEVVCRVLEEAGCPYQALWRGRLGPARRADLVISVGGDGTFLETSHGVIDRPILGVNSDPAHSLGIFCAGDRRRFPALFRRWREGKLSETLVRRLRVTVEGRPIREPVLNDLLFAHPNPAIMARYVLSVATGSRRGPPGPGRGTWRELQKSSGLWIATAAGSTGGVLACGGRILRPESLRMQFALREPYRRGGVTVRHVRGVLPAGARLRITSRMRRAALYVDGGHLVYPLRWGSRIDVSTDAPPLRVVGLDPARRRKIFGGE